MSSASTMLKQYIHDIEKFPLISAAREKELSKIILESKKESEVTKARNEMVEGNLRIVVKLATSLYFKIEKSDDINMSVMDLIQAGNIGLIRAAELFSYKKNFKFCTYAYPCIIQKMRKALMKSRFIRVPSNHFKHISNLKEIEHLEGGHNLSENDIKLKLDVTDDMFNMIKREKSHKINIDEVDIKIEDIPDTISPIPDKSSESNQLRQYLYEKMKMLKPFQRDIVFYKFFGNEEETLNSIGGKFGVSGEFIRTTMKEALKSLKLKISKDILSENEIF